MDDDERNRLRLVLDKLTATMRGDAGAVRFDELAPGQKKVCGVATPEGAIRLGIELARFATDYECGTIHIRNDGIVTSGDDHAVVEIELTDERAFPRPEQRPSLAGRVTCGIAIALAISTLVLAVIGFCTLLVWLRVVNW